MAYTKILLLAVAVIAALGAFGEKDKEKASEYTKVLFETAWLYIIAIIAECAQNCLY